MVCKQKRDRSKKGDKGAGRERNRRECGGLRRGESSGRSSSSGTAGVLLIGGAPRGGNLVIS